MDRRHAVGGLRLPLSGSRMTTDLNLNAEQLLEWSLDQPLTTRCLFCDWTITGTHRTNQDEYRKHAWKAHRKKVKAPRHRRPHWAPIVLGKGLSVDENIANARAEGAAAWTSEEAA